MAKYIRKWNPNAAAEQAKLIEKLFNSNVEYEEYTSSDIDDITNIQTITIRSNFDDLPNEIIVKIMVFVGSQRCHKRATGKFTFRRSQIRAIKMLYRLRRVCRRFNGIITSNWRILPKPTIGLRIQSCSDRNPYYDDHIVMYIYGSHGSVTPAQFVRIRDVPTFVFPSRVETHLIISHLILDESLLDMLAELDLSKVEEFYCHNIIATHLENAHERIRHLMEQLESAMVIEFTSMDPDYSLSMLFPEPQDSSINYWETMGFDREDSELTHEYYRKMRKVIRREKKNLDM